MPTRRPERAVTPTPSVPTDLSPARDLADDGVVTWRRALVIGLVAYVISRLCVVAGAAVRAAQLAVDANRAGEPHPGSAARSIVSVLTSWDGLWYLEIVRSGYPRTIPPEVTYFQDEARAAFFPLYPMLVRVVDVILPGGDTMAALATNLMLGAIAVVLVGMLARRLTDTTTAMHSMVLFSVFPGSFVLSFAYSEALFVALAAGCLLALVDERWLLAGALAALGTATRPNGVALVAACAIGAIWAIRSRREWTSLVAVALAPLGFVAFQVFLARHADEPWPWIRVQREAWAEGTSFGGTAIAHVLGVIRHPLSSPTEAVTVLTLTATAVAVWAWWRLRPPALMTAYVAVILALMLIPETVTARPRFLFAAFPLVIGVAAWLPRRDRDLWGLVLVSCGAGLTALTGLYAAFGAIP